MKSLVWVARLLRRSLLYRRGRTVLLIVVMAMASSLVTSLGVVSLSMKRRVAEELRRYGANLVILPHETRYAVGSGALSFGSVGEQAFLDQQEVERSLAHRKALRDHSVHLQGLVGCGEREVRAEGIRVSEVRRLFPWWQVSGEWPSSADGALVGGDLAATLKLKVGDLLRLHGRIGDFQVTVAGVLATGGDEDTTIFLDLDLFQRMQGWENRLSEVRVIASTDGASLAAVAAELQPGVPGGKVMEVRQVAATGEQLLRKVQLLMGLVAAVVVVAASCSVMATMSSTVLERGKEVGLLKAMGGSSLGVLGLFAAESVALGGGGGIVGGLAGYGIGAVVMTSVFAAPAEFPLLPGVAAIGVSLVIALGASLGPLVAVYRLDAVRTLRGE